MDNPLQKTLRPSCIVQLKMQPKGEDEKRAAKQSPDKEQTIECLFSAIIYEGP